ncbi:hypothetical protein C5746_41675 [Streptomyces atratus]|uniref:Uncharacterized protein n=1 Tax=Streptomyces atratus TaxID=1893 RepID=A0A2Z5JPI6_STRAR|nr:hypothetical protein C5746_41675 [Streptomyces atratus]
MHGVNGRPPATQLRLARPLAADLRRPRERPTAPNRPAPARARRCFTRADRSTVVNNVSPAGRSGRRSAGATVTGRATCGGGRPSRCTGRAAVPLRVTWRASGAGGRGGGCRGGCAAGEFREER